MVIKTMQSIRIASRLTLVILEFLDPKLPVVTKVAHPSKNLSLKSHDLLFYNSIHITLYLTKMPYLKSFTSKLLSLSLRSTLTRTGFQKMRELSIFRFFNESVNFSTESVKKQRIYDFLYHITI